VFRIFRLSHAIAFGLVSLQQELPLITLSAAYAQQSSTTLAGAEAAGDNAPLEEEELAIMVARIALYPDELVALMYACGEGRLS
jgi:hypothetical protein